MRASLPLTEQNRDSAPEPESGTTPTGTGESRPRGEDDPVPTLREVFDEYAPFVWRTLRHLGIREADVEDICQEVFVAVHRKLESFEGRSTLRTWLYGICLRTASDHRRRAYVRRERAVSEVPASVVEPTQERDVERRQARRLLADILDSLDEDKRAVFVLYELEELPMKEVSEIIGCPLQTAYSRLHTARKLVVERARELNGNGEAQ